MAVPSASQQGRPSPPPPPKWPTVEELQTYSKEQLRLLAVRMNIPLIIHNTKDEILALVVKKMNDKSARGLSKDRSLRVAVIEKDILKSRKIGPPGQAAQIVEKTEDRTFNPHKALIAQEGRRRSGQPLQAESTEEDLDTVSDNSNDATAAMPSGTFAAENPVKNRMLARQPTEKMAAYSSNSDVATSQLSSRPVTAQIPARNGALTRQSTLSRVSHLQLQRSPAKNPAVLTPRSVQATAQHPPSHRVLTGQATTRTQHAQKPVEKTAASPSKSIQHAPSASSSQNIFRSPVGNPMLTRQPTIHIPSVQKQPSKVISRQPSKNVDNGAAVASSSRAIAQNPSGNGTLTRQRTIRIPNVQQQHRGEAEKEEQRRDNKFDDMRAVQRIGRGKNSGNDSGKATTASPIEEEQFFQKSSEAEGHAAPYDEYATFDDFFPDQKIEVDEVLDTYEPYMEYTTDPPAHLCAPGDRMMWLEKMYSALCEEVDNTGRLVKYLRRRADKAVSEATLRESEVRQVKALVAILDRAIKRDAGPAFYEHYQQLLADGYGETSEESDVPPFDEVRPTENTNEEKGWVDPSTVQLSKGEYILTPPLSESPPANTQKPVSPKTGAPANDSKKRSRDDLSDSDSGAEGDDEKHVAKKTRYHEPMHSDGESHGKRPSGSRSRGSSRGRVAQVKSAARPATPRRAKNGPRVAAAQPTPGPSASQSVSGAAVETADLFLPAQRLRREKSMRVIPGW